MSASTQNRIMIWRSEVASAMDDAASSAASSTGNTCSLSDSHSSAEYSWSQAQSGGAMARGRRFWRSLARRLSGGRFGGMQDATFQREPTTRTAMYRAPPPPVDARGATAAHEHVVDPEEDSSDGKAGLARGGLKEKQERLERAARLLDQQPAATAWVGQREEIP
ncbi:hypothetical protein EsDP_00001364 [Epichloe bromicola]|uniref:Uncharacterized protein n=1 Tax=Epichloe bromicola TaxID=79588 RepID=A0ABQ0CHM5_9HYPO